MKAAVSIPDDVFQRGEHLARCLNTSRSQLYARALADFVAQHDEDRITSAMNRVVDEVGAQSAPDGFTHRAARKVLRHVEWQSPKVNSGGPTSVNQLVRGRASGARSLQFKVMR